MWQIQSTIMRNPFQGECSMDSPQPDLYFTLVGGLTGRVASSSASFGDRERMLFQAYVPGIEFCDPQPSCDVSIQHVESDKKDIVRDRSRDRDNIALYDQWNGQVSMDIFHLTYAAAREYYLENGNFTVHAACVGLDDLVLLAGPSGSGKSTVAQNLIERGRAKLFSGNKTVVYYNDDATLSAVAGTKTMTIPTAFYKQKLPAGNTVNYGDRTAYQLNKNDYASPGKIGAVYIVRLNDGVEDFQRVSQMSAVHALYPSFLDATNADVIVGGDMVYDSPNTPFMQLIKSFLAQQLARATRNLPVYKVTGSLPFVVETIERNEEGSR
jgi:hypothetical protein